jgi:hypothetical protein
VVFWKNNHAAQGVAILCGTVLQHACPGWTMRTSSPWLDARTRHHAVLSAISGLYMGVAEAQQVLPTTLSALRYAARQSPAGDESLS